MTIPFRPDASVTPATAPAEPVTPPPAPDPIQSVPPKLKGVADSVKMLLDRNATTEQINKYLQDRGFKNGLTEFKTTWRLATQQPVDTSDPNFAASLDRSTGAPIKARNAVAGLPNPDAQMDWLHNNGYPDAIPYKDTYVYTDQKTGRPKLFSQEGPGIHGVLAVLGALPGMGSPGNVPSPDAGQALNTILGKAVDNAPTLGGLAGQVYGGVKGAVKGAALGALGGVPEVGGVMGALTGGGTGFTAGKEAVQGIQRGIAGVPDPRTMGQAGDDLANEFKLGLVSEAAGRMTGPILKTALGAPSAIGDWMTTLSPETRGMLRPQTRVLMEYAKDLGVPAGLAQTSRGLILNGVTGILRRMPIASTVLNAADEAGNAGMARAVQRVSDQMAIYQGPFPAGETPAYVTALRTGGAGVEAGAGAMQEGALKVVQNYRQTRQAMQQVFQQTMGGADANVPALPNASSLAVGLQAEMARAPGVNTPLLTPALNAVQRVLGDAAGHPPPASPILSAAGAAQPSATIPGKAPGIPLDILQRARTAIGEVAFDDSPLLRADPTVKYLRDVYGSLTQDLTNAAQQSDRAAGFIPKGPTDMGPAETALVTHDRYVSNFMDDGQLGNFNTFKKLAESPMGTDPLAWVTANSKTNPAAVTKVLAQFSPPERDAVVGSLFQQMGRASSTLQNDLGNVWDPKVFQGNWDKIRLVRGSLFDGTRFAATADDIDKIYQLAQRMPKPKGASPIGSILAPLVEFEGAERAGASGVGAVAAVGGLTVGSAVAARLLSDPTFSRIMLNAATAAQKGAVDASPYLVRLLFLQRKNPALAPAITEYTAALQSQGVQMPGTGTFDRLATPGTSYSPRP